MRAIQRSLAATAAAIAVGTGVFLSAPSASAAPVAQQPAAEAIARCADQPDISFGGVSAKAGKKAARVASWLYGKRLAHPQTGCSGLVQFAWSAGGQNVPNSPSTQWATLQHVPLSQIKAGDIVVFNNATASGIYVGHGKVVHGYTGGGIITKVPLQSLNLTGIVRPGSTSPGGC